jgi:hypothetical protein
MSMKATPFANQLIKETLITVIHTAFSWDISGRAPPYSQCIASPFMPEEGINECVPIRYPCLQWFILSSLLVG